VVAAALHVAFLRDTVALAQAVPAVEVVILYPPRPEAPEALREAVGPAVRLLPQCGAGLGDALSGAAATLLADGFDQVALISSDNPTLPADYVVEAFVALPHADVVLGPAEDGGYYLIALRQPHPGLFQAITWSTAVVFEQTLARAAGLGLRVATTPPWYDVDDLAAFDRLRAEIAAGADGVAAHTRRFLQSHRLGNA
jgi:rSAM/selenodomain-associated transferase 1